MDHQKKSVRRASALAAPLSRLRRALAPYPEALLLILCLAVLLAGLATGLPFLPLNTHAAVAFLQYYLVVLLVALAMHLVIVLFPGPRRRPSGIFLFLSFPTLIVVAFCYFQFKTWMPLVHPHLFDPAYQHADRLMSPLVALFTRVQQPLLRAGIHLGADYEGLFFLLFFVAFTLHAFFDTVTGQRQVVFGVACILGLGGLSYWITPSVGPFVFRTGLSAHTAFLQHSMLRGMDALLATRSIPPAYFGLAPAAMPSLHVAHTLFLVWMMRRISPWLTVAFCPFFLWICTASVALAWHYLLDIPAGIALAGLTVFLVTRLLPDAHTPETSPILARSSQPRSSRPDHLAPV